MEILRRLDSVISHHNSEGLTSSLTLWKPNVKGLQELGVVGMFEQTCKMFCVPLYGPYQMDLSIHI